ncbi:MAG TPA: Ig-like domain-containing protein [Solirubrobacteraceae bacterium]|nr:Ig-like domain-containing protein [Solirubrobacteraceae bacterium]
MEAVPGRRPSRLTRLRLIGLCLLAICVLGSVAAASASALPKALIDEATVSGGTESQEAEIATAQGFEVAVVSDEAWGKMTQAEFGEYQVLIAGDPTCGGLPAGLVESAAVYGPVVLGTAGGRTAAGNRIVVGTDPVFHDGGDYTSPGARGTIIRDGIGFAGKLSGRTGMYFDASCSDGIQATEDLEILEALSNGTGSWTVDGSPPCGGNVSLIASNPSFLDLTTESLQGWGCSVHESYPTFPTDWSALAVATDTASHPTCGVDPNTEESACGEAYLLVAGTDVVVKSGSIELTPPSATNPVGTDHTVTAHVTSEGNPLAGQTVTFTVTGVNEGAAGTCEPSSCVTDSSGNVTFTYHDTNGEGDDTIKASFTDEGGSLQSATAKKHWGEGGKEEPTTTTTSLSGGGQSGPNITVSEGTAVTDQATLTGTNAGSATGTVSYKVYSDSECKVEVADAGTVPVSGGSAPASSPESLAQGKYYWQATYSGDGSLNEGSTSECGSEVETVGPPPPPPCTKAIGSATFKAAGEKAAITNKLYTEPTKKQKQVLVLKWENGANALKLTRLASAVCTVTAKKAVFDGLGEATLNGEPGWTVKFKLVLTTKKHRFAVHAKITKPGEETLRVNGAATSVSSEEIA